MLQPSAIPSPISMELTQSLQQTLAGGKSWRLRSLGLGIPLPNSSRSFLLFLLGLAVVSIGLIMQISLSIHIWQTSTKIGQLKAEYQAIEQQNTAIVWEIAQQSTLDRVRQRAQDLGYKVVMDRYYMPASGTTQLAAANLPSANKPKLTPAETQINQVGDAQAAIAQADQGAVSDFANNLHAATDALRQWWQRQ